MRSASAAETEDSVVVYGNKSPHTNGSNKKRTDTWCVKADTQEKSSKNVIVKHQEWLTAEGSEWRPLRADPEKQTVLEWPV